ncbi:hypothetical protein [Acidithiobacillus caldus]|jgi:hypothetical protein|uniref:Uncharacterized protein n=2 Tax=Acidithiobacillus caldus TaxID=33059 RepID=A0A1E7YP76_9PROT|nr:hypothetical protein [Acidithiobacillus caldus]AIA55561.1 hypothetical protein Acaty_c1701 [Acidithiobacillus caldus ATCC 51756]MBU2729293.1 hypothetical protein [Acidithiobacillus caldus]MBU2736518.1 hypothetical protein [Acidithiobacillus caldus ATCC 51756]MBU2744826.1 hypothetical protein [Acidithiobacillus caldus]MBU2762325.1 hypothetical protein [Acidithiobacillus caldus]
MQTVPSSARLGILIGVMLTLSGCYVVPPRGPVAVVQPGPVVVRPYAVVRPYGYWHPGWWGPWGWHRGYWYR